MKPIACIVGTRPNDMKMAPIQAAFDAHDPSIPHRRVHTGQHDDTAMERVFFEALGLPTRHANLAVGAGTHAVRTARIMERLGPVLDAVDAASVLVLGDVNATVAAAIVAANRNLPLIHVETGLRRRERSMPAEVNRILIDAVSDLLFTTERGAAANLAREGVSADRIVFAGNVTIDALDPNRDRFVKAQATLAAGDCPDAAGQIERGHAVATLHRPSNIEGADSLRRLLEALGTNRLIGTDPAASVDRYRALKAEGALSTGASRTGRRPGLWDGRAANRIASEIWARRSRFLAP